MVCELNVRISLVVAIMSTESDLRSEIAGGESFPHQRSVSLSSEAVPYLLPAMDVLVIVLSSLAGGFAYQLSMGNSEPGLIPLCAVGLLAGFVYFLQIRGTGHYEFSESAEPRVEIRGILFYWFTTGSLLALVAFLLKVGSHYSRGSFIIFYLIAPLGLLNVRKLVKVALGAAISRGAIGDHETLLIGDSNELELLKPQDLLATCGTTQVNRFALSRDDDPLVRSSTDKRIINLATDFARRHRCRQVLLALPWSDAGRIELVRHQIKSLPVAVRLLPDESVRTLNDAAWSSPKRLPAIEIQRAPLSTAQRFIKRTMDLLGASLALIFLLPIIALAALAIKLDSPGPVIFRQTRKGFNGRHFVIYKFRTMTVQENGAVVVQAVRNDSRVTAVGQLLRSASIDELPQLVNVLKGDMSLIGPRPHALAHDNYFESILGDYAFRQHVKPGITGWAQCNGARGATPSVEHVADRVKHDLWYINNWSLWLDIEILIKTFFEVLRKRNAY